MKTWLTRSWEPSQSNDATEILLVAIRGARWGFRTQYSCMPSRMQGLNIEQHDRVVYYVS